MTTTQSLSKKCKRCGRRKSLKTGWYKSITSHCKECWKQHVRDRYDREYETKIRKYEAKRAQDPRRKANALEYQRKRRSRYPQKYKARSAVSNALRSGKLVRMPCRCGSKRVQAHHNDYAKPLAVTWLCFRCHRQDEHKQKHVSDFRERGPSNKLKR